MDRGSINTPYPAQLANWAGHRAGGVRRLFDEGSGRPSRKIIHTNLLTRLKKWAHQVAQDRSTAPRIILLVGGPGNGKTEAIEATIGWLDDALASAGRLKTALGAAFRPNKGELVPRLVEIDAGALANPVQSLTLSIVQDASTISEPEAGTAAQQFLNELLAAAASTSNNVYLCCVNRGILDDALIESIERDVDGAKSLLETITQAVSLLPKAGSCWPLPGHDYIAVWPMDAESLLIEAGQEGVPARELLATATDERQWPAFGSCAAGQACPFCTNRQRLSQSGQLEAFLKIMRWYEVGSGKRWSFRDLFSLTSYLLSGHETSPGPDSNIDPCSWASKLVRLHEQAKKGQAPKREVSTAIFKLVAAQYQNALFHRWDRGVGRLLYRDIRDLGLQGDHAAMGLQWFLSSREAAHLPATIAPFLEGLCDLLDPARAMPDAVVGEGAQAPYSLRDIDLRFSRSVSEGLEFVRKKKLLTQIEIDLLERMAGLDSLLSSPEVRRKRPAVAGRVQRIVRDFSCRLIRRNIGAKYGIVPDASILDDFQHVLQGSQGDELYDVAQEVKKLLNKDHEFEISLTTTFGQPLPPLPRRAILAVPAIVVRPFEIAAANRPKPPVPFLTVGSGRSEQAIPLTYDLFKAVRELERGMSVASLPRTVNALLDTARARLSGPIVRDHDILDRAKIRLGADGVEVERRRSRFVMRKKDAGV